MPESSAERSQLNPQGWVPTSGKNCSTKVKEAENRILRNMKKAFDKGREKKRRRGRRRDGGGGGERGEGAGGAGLGEPC